MQRLEAEDISRIIEMAWEDRTPFEAIQVNFGLSEQQVIELMRHNLKITAFKNWRRRVSGRTSKHLKLRAIGINRGYCPTQYKITGNKRK